MVCVTPVPRVRIVPVVRRPALSGMACVLEVCVSLTLVHGSVTAFARAVCRPLLVAFAVVPVLGPGTVVDVLGRGTVGSARC